MKKLFIVILLFLSIGLFAYEMDYTYNPNLTPVKYGLGNFKEKGHGNFRVGLNVQTIGEFVYANVEWRRHDKDPQYKGIVVENSKGEVVNSRAFNITQMTGDIVFEAKEMGTYYLYYLPYDPSNSYYVPKTDYYPAKSSSDKNWLKKLGDTPDFSDFPKAYQTIIEARNEFNSMYPMEVPASEEEFNQLVKSSNNPYLVFAEDRIYQIKMRYKLPYKWYKSGEITDFIGYAQPNEIYTFQIGIYGKEEVNDFTVIPSDFSNGEQIIKAENIHCINTGGIDFKGRTFSKTLTIAQGNVQPLWFYVQMPKNAKGWYKGTITLKSSNFPDRTVDVKIGIKGDILENGGIDDLWRMSRISWLDSKNWINDEVVAPYIPIKISNSKASVLHRDFYFNEMGLPCRLVAHNREILNKPIGLSFYSNGNKIEFKNKSSKILVKNKGAYEFVKEFTSELSDLSINGRLEFDGVMEYNVTLKANKDFTLDNSVLETYINENIAKYFMGLGGRGGKSPKIFNWEFNPNRLDYMVWLGDYNAGVQIALQPIDHNYRLWGPVEAKNFSPGWYNNGVGNGILERQKDNYMVKFQGGKKEFKRGETCDFSFRVIVTPFKDINPEQYKIRSAAGNVGNFSNIFHGTETNPYINYPFIKIKEMTAYRDEIQQEAIDEDITKKPLGKMYTVIYYTSREISNHCYEIWALRSLGDEIFDKQSMLYTGEGAKIITGQGGGYQWLAEHLEDNYVVAWHMPIEEDHDAAIANKWDSRWMNYYVEGLNYLMREAKIDGVYLDGIGFGRETMKRMARVMSSYKPDYVIHYHDGNNYDWNELKTNIINNSMEYMAFITKLYAGEFFDFANTEPAYWLTEISGIPFGLRNEVLDFYKNGDNPWKHTVFAMTGWSQKDNLAIYDLWDRRDIGHRNFIGWFDTNPVVNTHNDKVFASAFTNKNSALVFVANWDNKPVKIDIDLDYKAMGLDPNKCTIKTEYMKNLQEEKELSNLKNIELPVNGGIIFFVESK